MLDLLKVELKSLIKFKPARLMLLLYPVLGILIALMMGREEAHAFTALINGMFLVNMITTAVGGLFVYLDHSQNTIRNKIIVGHTRLSVYAAKFAVTFCFFMSCVLLFGIPTIVLDYFMIGFDNVTWEAVWKNLVIIFCNMTINVALVVFLTMTVRTVVGAILPFCAVEFLAVGGSLWLEILSVDNKELFEIVSSIPSIKALMLTPTIVPADVGQSCLITVGIIVSLMLIGYLNFRKTDIN